MLGRAGPARFMCVANTRASKRMRQRWRAASSLQPAALRSWRGARSNGRSSPVFYAMPAERFTLAMTCLRGGRALQHAVESGDVIAVAIDERRQAAGASFEVIS